MAIRVGWPIALAKRASRTWFASVLSGILQLFVVRKNTNIIQKHKKPRPAKDAAQNNENKKSIRWCPVRQPELLPGPEQPEPA